ncbi:MAG TPA: YbgC/FadM family acyl-CoA thioesterase [Magnetospirillaceae bacterium]|jgi:acyl-CoA thioester hydrolase
MNAEQAGRMVGKTHHFPVRVYFADTDAAGMVYHATYFSFAERARTEMMRMAGFDHVTMNKTLGLLLGVHSCDAEYMRPARLDDLLEMRTSVAELGGASIRLRQDVWRDNEELVRMGVRLVCIGVDGKTARIPNDMRDKVRTLLSSEAQ